MRLLLLILLLPFGSIGQNIILQNIQIIPSNPTDQDSIKAIVDVTLTSSNCWIDKDTMYYNNSTNPALDIEYCTGILSTLCNRTDTFDLGGFAPGSYTLSFYGKSKGSNCSSVVSQDTGGVAFTVQSAASVKGSASKYGVQFSKYGDSYLVNLSDVYGIQEIVLYNLSGAEVRRWSSWEQVLEIKKPDTAGVYILRMRFAPGMETADKLIFE